LIVREHAKSAFRGPVLCLGVPDIYLTHDELNACLPQGRDPHAGGSFVTAAEFLDALGVHEVTSIDIPGSEHPPDFLHDLNRPLGPEFEERFNLVIDPGTMEHVFDVRSGLTNVTRSLAIGGAVIHFVPIYSYNGGYFSINPSVLHDFYGANGFADIRSYIIMWDRYRPFTGRSRCYPYGPVMAARHALADHDQCRFTPHLLFFARKVARAAEVTIPIQHEHRPVRPQRRAGKLLRRVLPPALATYLVAMIRREAQLRRSRRESFWI
jgi:hypothetical protein